MALRSVGTTAARSSDKPAVYPDMPDQTFFSGSLVELRRFFLDAIKEMYWAEQQLLSTLPKMQYAATTLQLHTALSEQLVFAKDHIAALEDIFALMNKKPQANKSEAMRGLLGAAKSMLEETEKTSYTRDLGIIMTLQKIEHYKMASYQGLIVLAQTMEAPKVAEILITLLQEEQASESGLCQLAEGGIRWVTLTED